MGSAHLDTEGSSPLKDPWFDNIRTVAPKAALEAARAHQATDVMWSRDPKVIVVVDCPKRLREALQRG